MKILVFALLSCTYLHAWNATLGPTYSLTDDNLDGKKSTYSIYADSAFNIISDSYSSKLSLSYSDTKYDNFHELKKFKLKELAAGNFISDETLNGHNKFIQIGWLQELSHTMRTSLSYGKSWSDLSNRTSTYKLSMENDLADKTHILALAIAYTRIDQTPRVFVGHKGSVTVPEYYQSIIISLKDAIVLSKIWLMELGVAYRQKGDRPEAFNVSMVQSLHITPLDAAIHIGGSFFDEHNTEPYNATYGSMTGHTASAIWSQNIIDILTIDLGLKYYYEREALLTKPIYAKLASNTYSFKTEWNLPETFPETTGNLGIEDMFASVEIQYYKTNRDLSSKSILISLKGTI